MSEPQPEDWDQFVDWSPSPYDWSKADLLDACYDPVLQSTDPDGQHGRRYLYNESPMVEDSLLQTLVPDSNNRDKQFQATCASCDGTIIYENLWHLGRVVEDLHSTKGCLFWACTTPECPDMFMTRHCRINTALQNGCGQCEQSFASQADLLRHAKSAQHQPFACKCGSSFSRVDVLRRHLRNFATELPEHPCKYCRRHRGENGFRRLDHLMQHIRNYHHHEQDSNFKVPDESRLKFNYATCPHSDCDGFRDALFKKQPRKVQHANRPFVSQAAFTRHMRDEHNECTFPCDVLGCERIGRQGYFREKDLLKHRQNEHPDAGPYQVAQREFKIRCTEEGCSAVLEPSSMINHLFGRHNVSYL
ncbi:hypothetical protein VTL71DRAFT_10429 [Oculimacula yallundae]|uniref:C2H2-type domain-containing protein n=1 Tax=Oculimacula yallundae TaxID=86028 RepID=A0ABR4CTC7_9HELO